MQLLNNLFRITDSESADATTSRYRIELCSDSPIYKAHFPGMPVTPGVCIVQMAVELFEHATGLQLQLQAIKNAKFIAVMSPNDATAIGCSLTVGSATDTTISAQTVMTNGSTTYAKLSFTCRKV